MDEARRTLRDVFGFPDFRPGQEEVVRAVLDGEDVLAVMPTGGGKSLLYQLPALLRGGLTLVVSPLIALMRDQVAQLRDWGVAAGALNSANDSDENRRVADAVREGRMRLLYASPERLASAATVQWLARSGVGLVAIDEAHCVSQWGHDFRPDYAMLGEVRRRLGGVQAIALTATADAVTRDDIVARLFESPPRVFVQGFDRPNLHLAMQPKENARRQLLDFIKTHAEMSGIVYCSSRNATERIAAMLSDEGLHALAYHAGMDGAARSRHQDAFLQEDGVVMVATTAFGMGIDKPDVRFVAHAAMPGSIEAYYQEIGRAGRDGAPADTLTLYGLEDIRLRRLQIEDTDASEERKRIERARLGALVALCEAPRCRRQTLLAYFGESTEPCGHCDLCEGGAEVFDGTVEAQKILSAIARTGERFGVEHLVSVLVGDGNAGVLRHRHEQIKTFGAGRDRPRGEWRSLARQAVGAGLAALDVAGHGGLSLTERGWEVLRGRERVAFRVDVLRPRERRRAAAARTVAEVPAHDAALLATLKALRTRIAREANVPAYVVFPDRTLIEMAASRPRTLAALRGLHGVGTAKLARYGAAFLDALKGDSTG